MDEGGYQQPRSNGFQPRQNSYQRSAQNRGPRNDMGMPMDDDYAMGGYSQPKPSMKQDAPKADEDLGPAFPSEAAMDEVPF